MVLQLLFRYGRAAFLLAPWFSLGCAGQGASTEAGPAPDSSKAMASSSPAKTAPALLSAPASSSVVAPALLAPPGDAGSDAGSDAQALSAGLDAGLDAGAKAEAEQPYAKDNKRLPPPDSEELQARAKLLWEAIVKNEPSVGDPFWFPKEPFIPLKDVKDPGKYWENLHKSYANDIAKLHRKRKSWDGAEFKRFELGSTPKWVPPGDEANKIGYYRSFRGKLRYDLEGTHYSLEVHTVISWQGRWYITHLSKFKKK